MKVDIEITEKDLRKLVATHIRDKIDINVKDDDIVIQVKSKQNYKSEWEHADFKAVYKKDHL